MKEYKIRILMQCGTTQQWMTEIIKAKKFWVGTSGNYYFFQTEDDKVSYYPVNSTIINEL